MFLEKIKNQNRARSLLYSFIRKGKIPHSLIFTGIQGVGKFTTAIEFSRYLLCDNHGNDECHICKLIERYEHPDVHIIRPEKKEIKISQIRNLIKEANLKTFTSRYKIFIIDDADAMRDIAENSFLKTLEEPPDNTIIILIVHNINKLLPTIISRCIKVQFSPLKPEIINQILREKFNLSEEARNLISFLSENNMQDAILLMENELYRSIIKWLKVAINILNSLQINPGWLFNIIEEVNTFQSPRKEKILILYFHILQRLIHQIYINKNIESFILYLESKPPVINNFYIYKKAIGIINNAIYQLNSTNIDPAMVLLNTFLLIKNP